MDEDKLKLAFSRIKEDIFRLDTEINKNKERILEVLELVKSLKNQNELILKRFNDSDLNSTNLTNSSIGNKGVQSINHSSITHQSITQTSNILDIFRKFTNKELLIFLTIYQLEEEKKSKISYQDIAEKLSLSNHGVRSYVSTLISKGATIHKVKENNRLTFLSIDSKFKELNLKSALIDIYYQRDPNQRRLSDL
jgi:hypothetical protein